MKQLSIIIFLSFFFQNLYAINPKAENMAKLFVEQALKSEKEFGKNPNMDIKTYSIKNYVYQDRKEYFFSSSEISVNKNTYIEQIEAQYCSVLNILINKYDVVFVFSIFGKNGNKSFSHQLVCK